MPGPNSLDFAIGLPATKGPPSSFLDNFDALFDLTYKVDSTLGFEYEVEKRWRDSIAKAEARLGTSFGWDPSSLANGDQSIPVMNKFVQPAIDPNGERTLANFLMSGTGGDEQDQLVARAREINERIRLLNDPSIKTIDQLIEDVIADRGVIRGEAAQVQERAGFTGTVGGFAGAIAGSFSTRDPVNLITLPLGGFGRNIATKMATEALVAGSTEYGVQKTSIQPTQRVLGEEESNAALNALLVGGGAGLLRGGFEGIAALVGKKLKTGELDPFDFTDDQLRQMFERMPDTPTARAGVSLMEDAQQFSAANPYSPSGIGARQFHEDLTDIASLMSGKTDTAIARFLPEKEFTIDNLDFDTRTVKEQSPVLFGRVADTQARVAEIDEQITTISNKIDEVTVIAESREHVTAKAVEIKLRVEQRVISLEERIADPNLPEKDRIDLIAERDKVVDTFNKGDIEQVIETANVPLKQELQALRKERSSAQGQYTRARNALDKEITRVRSERELNERIFGERQPSGDDFDPQRLRPDVLARFEDDVNSTALILDDSMEIAVRTVSTDELESQINIKEERLNELEIDDPEFKKLSDEIAVLSREHDEIAVGKKVPEGELNLGGVIIDSKFRMLDPDDPSKEITAGELIKRLKEDEALIAAMKGCAI